MSLGFLTTPMLSLSLSLGLSFAFDGLTPPCLNPKSIFTFCFRPYYVCEFLFLASYFTICFTESHLFVG